MITIQLNFPLLRSFDPFPEPVGEMELGLEPGPGPGEGMGGGLGIDMDEDVGVGVGVGVGAGAALGPGSSNVGLMLGTRSCKVTTIMLDVLIVSGPFNFVLKLEYQTKQGIVELSTRTPNLIRISIKQTYVFICVSFFAHVSPQSPTHLLPILVVGPSSAPACHRALSC